MTASSRCQARTPARSAALKGLVRPRSSVSSTGPPARPRRYAPVVQRFQRVRIDQHQGQGLGLAGSERGGVGARRRRGGRGELAGIPVAVDRLAHQGLRGDQARRRGALAGAQVVVQGDQAAVDRLVQARPVGHDHAFRTAAGAPAGVADDRHRHRVDRAEAAARGHLAALGRRRAQRDEISVEHGVPRVSCRSGKDTNLSTDEAAHLRKRSSVMTSSAG